MNRYKSHTLLAYESLFRRLLPRYRSNEIIKAEYLKHLAGFQGEKRIDYKLSLFPRTDFLHLPGLRLQNNMNFFQMDSVILTPKVIFIIEAKNVKGILEYYGVERQLIQKVGKKENCYKDPILQAMTQKKHLEYWLQSFGVDIPIEPIVVSTNQQAIIKNMNDNKELSHRFVTLEDFLYKLDEIYELYNRKVLNQKELHRLSSSLQQFNLPLKSFLIKQYRIKQHHLINGIPCAHCDAFPLDKIPRSWYCPNCSYKGSAHYQRVILDYFLLHNKPFIKNDTCRTILNIDSIDTVSYLLKKTNLKVWGDKKGRKYLAPNLSEFPQDAEPKRFEISIFDR